MNPFLTVYGHVTIDQILRVQRFPVLNETVDVMDKKTTLGGTGSNIAIAAARLGVPTALAAYVGPDFPQAFTDLIRDSGVIMDDFVAADGYETSSCTIVNTDAMEQKVVFYQGPQGSGSRIGKDLAGCARHSKKVHFCTGEADWYLGMMKELSGKVDIAVDPAQETYRFWNADRLRLGIERGDSLFCNEFEAKVMEERLGVGSVTDIDLPLVVRTEGGNGSLARIDGDVVRIPCIPGEAIVDPTGCGDSYRAGFYAGLYRGFSVRDSLVLGASVASFVIEKTGAITNIPSWDDAVRRADPYLEG
jgi:sugar/nucleoside kinase (ribokinase family)